MAPAGKDKSSGGSTSSNLKNGEIIFTDQPAGGEKPLKRGEVFESPEGVRAVVQRVEKDGTVVYEKQRAKDIRARKDEYFSRQPKGNFGVTLKMGDMERLEPTMDEKQLEELGVSFARKFESINTSLDNWAASLREEDEDGVRLYEQLYAGIEKIGSEWNVLGDHVEAGQEKQRVRLFSALRLLEVQIPDEAETEDIPIKQKKGKILRHIPRHDNDERTDTDAVAKKTGRKSAPERTKPAWQPQYTEAPAERANAEDSSKLASVPEHGAEPVVIATEGRAERAEGEVQPDQGRDIGKEEIDELIEGFGWILRDKALKVDQKIGALPLDAMPKSVGLYEVIQGRKIFLPMDKDDDYNGLYAEFAALPLAVRPGAEKKWLEMNFDLESEYIGKTFLIALEIAKKTITKEITEAVSLADLEKIGRETAVRKKPENARTHDKWRIFIEENTHSILGNRAEATLPLRKVIMNALEQRKGASQSGDHPSFENLLKSQLRPAITEANREIFSLWNSRRREFSGKDKRKREPRKARSQKGEATSSEANSFELTVPRERQETILGELQKFVLEGLKVIDEELKAEGGKGLDAAVMSEEPEERDFVTALITEHVGKHIVSIGRAYGANVPAGIAERVVAAIEEKGTRLLADAMSQRLLPDKTKEE